MALLPRDRTPRVAVIAALVVGLLAAGAMVLVLVRDDGDRPLTGDAAGDLLVDAWIRHRSGTFVVESDWRRTRVGSDDAMVSATLLAQRPPDRVQRQFGSVRGRLQGAPIRCSTDPQGLYQCFPSEATAPDYADEVATEAAALRSAVVGPQAIYAVTADDGGCFDLLLVRAYPDPQYGRSARLCFDEATGALSYLRRDLAEVVEEQEAVRIRAVVTDDDFDLAQDPAYDALPLPPDGDGSADDATGPDGSGPDATGPDATGPDGTAGG